jgi:hypothetical protein
MERELRSQCRITGNSKGAYDYSLYHSRIGIVIELYFIAKLSGVDPRLWLVAA